MNFVKALALVASLFVAGQALACPQHCLCDRKGNVVSNYRNLVNVSDRNLNKQIQSQTQGQGQSQTSTNTNQNVNNNQSNSTSNSTSSASLSNSGNSNNTNNVSAKGGNAKATANGGTASIGNVTTGPSTSSASASAAGAGSNNGNGSNDTTVTTINPRQVATAMGIAPPPTAPCSASLGAGGQTEVFGLSLSGSRRDQECVLEHQVYLLQQMGLNEAACYRARAGKEGADIDAAMKAAGVDCKTFATPLTVPAPADVVTHEELKEHEDRIITKVLQK